MSKTYPIETHIQRNLPAVRYLPHDLSACLQIISSIFDASRDLMTSIMLFKLRFENLCHVRPFRRIAFYHATMNLLSSKVFIDTMINQIKNFFTPPTHPLVEW